MRINPRPQESAFERAQAYVAGVTALGASSPGAMRWTSALRQHGRTRPPIYAALTICLFASVPLGVGCDSSANAAASKGATSETGVVEGVRGDADVKPVEPAQVAEVASASAVAKVVFVGQEKACNCTRERVDAAWAALSEALGTPPKVPVQRLQLDTQEAQVEPYRKQKPVFALPGLYFVDGQGQVLELLQGKVKPEQINAALKRP